VAIEVIRSLGSPTQCSGMGLLLLSEGVPMSPRILFVDTPEIRVSWGWVCHRTHVNGVLCARKSEDLGRDSAVGSLRRQQFRSEPLKCNCVVLYAAQLTCLPPRPLRSSPCGSRQLVRYAGVVD